MTLPESQDHLEDLFNEMLERLGAHNDAVMAVDEAGELKLTDEQLTAWEREFCWEFLARTLLLAKGEK